MPRPPLPRPADDDDAAARLITERIRMMEEMIQLQSKIRAKKEKERIIKTSSGEKYASMLEPVTKRL